MGLGQDPLIPWGSLLGLRLGHTLCRPGLPQDAVPAAGGAPAVTRCPQPLPVRAGAKNPKGACPKFAPAHIHKVGVAFVAPPTHLALRMPW